MATTTYTAYSNLPVLNAQAGYDGNSNTWLNTTLSSLYIAAFYDGEQRARVFDASVTLPQLNASFYPPGVNGYTAAGSITAAGQYQAQGATAGSGGNGVILNYYVDANGTAKLGEVLFQLTYAAGSLDSGSPSVFGVDQYLTFVTTTSSIG